MEDTQLSALLPYRGVFGQERPPALGRLQLPPDPMPSRDRLRPLKAWRYVGVFAEDLMVCAASVRIGPARQAFWAVWDREQGRWFERTTLRRHSVELRPARLRIRDPEVQVDLQLEEEAGIESVCPSGDSYAWTRKQGGIPARGMVALAGAPRVIEAMAVIDDTAAYYPRHTAWRWCAGVGTGREGGALAWNLVEGVNDPSTGSERTVWIDGKAVEPPPCYFASDLSGVADLRFHPEAARERHDNLVLVRSRYRQPFGTFTGALPGPIELSTGYGVMEAHEAWW